MINRRTPKWFLSAFSVGLGLVMLLAFWAGGNARQGVFALALMVVCGLFFLLGGRSEAIRGLRGDGRDEYWLAMDRDATLATGFVLIAAVIGMCLWEWGHGRDGTPYVQLGALAGVAYAVALVALRIRRR
jgi:hypothetical protein